MRRIVGDWPCIANERTAGATRLGFMFNHYARGSDLTDPDPSVPAYGKMPKVHTQAILLQKLSRLRQ